jgi:membrane fusion protein (multidrug efflux system)
LAERHFSSLSLNQAIEINAQAYPNTVFEGSISAINPGIDQDTRSVKVRATYANADQKLRAGMFAKINVLAADKQAVLTLPDTAISYHTYGDNVFAIVDKDGKKIAQQKTITTGKRQQGRVEILDGLKEGDIVVYEGQVKLRNNIPVTIKNQQEAALAKDSQ